MTAMTRFQITVLARLLARDVSGAAMKIDCRSLDALERRGLVTHGGEMARRGEANELRPLHAFTERTAVVTNRGQDLFQSDRHLREEVHLHLRLERDRATHEATTLEARAKLLRTRASHWDEALGQLGGTR